MAHPYDPELGDTSGNTPPPGYNPELGDTSGNTPGNPAALSTGYNPELGDTTGNAPTARSSSTKRKPAPASIPFWYDEENINAWDRLQIGKHVMPGVWKVTCTCSRDIDKKKSKGKDGGKVKDRGYQPAEMTFSGKLTEPGDWALLLQILPDIHPRKKGGKRSELKVQHPALAVMGVTTVYIKQIKAPEVDNGVMELAIEALEYIPSPVKKLGDFKTVWQLGGVQIEVPFEGVLPDSPVQEFLDKTRAAEMDRITAKDYVAPVQPDQTALVDYGALNSKWKLLPKPAGRVTAEPPH